MNYGLYISAAGTLTSLHRQDVLANNLANINTVGFKPDAVHTRSRLPERLESVGGLSNAFTAHELLDPQALLEQLGGGQCTNPTSICLRQGQIDESSNDLDLAIQGDGFFVVHNGSRSKDALRFTRDGRFTMNSQGELVMNATGMRVLDVNDQPIKLNRNAKVRIDGDGSVIQNGQTVSMIQVSTVADQSRLSKEGQSLMRFAGAKRQHATGSLKQNAVEASAVDPILALNSMINASKAVQANATMMQYHDNLLGQVVNTFGRVG